MEYLNKIILQGVVGSVKQTIIGKDNLLTRFVLRTDYMYTNENGGIVCESTWHTINAWQKNINKNLSKIERGSKLRVEGRLRNVRYTNTEGKETSTYDVLASNIEDIL